MSTIAENITRIQGAKNDIRTAIVGKGVEVPADAHIDEYAGYIQNIKTGGGGGGESSGKVVIPNGISLSGSTFTTLDMGNWDWSKVYDWGYMFASCSNLEAIENFPSDAELLSTNNMFNNCTSLTTAPLLDTSNVTDMGYMFSGCSNLTTVTPLNTSNVKNMGLMFYGCSSLTSVPQFDTSNVTDMRSMFSGCSNLTSVPQFDTSNVTLGLYMFNNCTSLTTAPLLDTSNFISMYYMFYGCSNLTSVPQLDISNVTDMTQMFSRCSSLREIRFVGKPKNSIKLTSIMSLASTVGTLYYPAEYADAYQKIINAFPSNWVKVAE